MEYMPFLIWIPAIVWWTFTAFMSFRQKFSLVNGYSSFGMGWYFRWTFGRKIIGALVTFLPMPYFAILMAIR